MAARRTAPNVKVVAAVTLGVIAALAVGCVLGWRLTDKSGSVDDLQAATLQLRGRLAQAQRRADTATRQLAEARMHQIQPLTWTSSARTSSPGSSGLAQSAEPRRT